jgi:uncharacterized membrane protein YdjX (TVP38/TMEM64 family)
VSSISDGGAEIAMNDDVMSGDAVIAPVVPGAASGERRGSFVAVGGMIALVIAAFGVMVWLFADPERAKMVEDLVRSPIGLIVLFGLAALSTATLILPAPGLALTAIAGAAGDPLVVGIVAGLGQAIGELTGYAAGWSGRSFLPDSPAMIRLTGWVKRRGMLVIFALALVPNPVFDVAGIAAGVLRMPLVRYLGAAASGKVIKNILVAGGASMLGGLLTLLGVGTT